MTIPKHIAIIMDGNGRWAQKKGLSRVFGHKAGVKSVEEIIRAADELGVSVLTLYAFSTENWKRPSAEINALFEILKYFIKKKLDELLRNNIRLMSVGDITKLPPSAAKEVKKAIERTSRNTGMILNIALNYGGRAEIIRAVNGIIADGKKSVDEKSFESYLYTAGLPDPDLIIRTSGEYRISNFLIWQSAYSEFYVTDVLWPDFGKKELLEAVAEYKNRNRRFGNL